MKTSTVVTIKTKKITSYKPSGSPVIEVIHNKQVVNQTLEKFYKYIGSQGYLSCELVKVIKISTTLDGKDTTREGSAKEFEAYKEQLIAVLKKNKINYGEEEKIEPFFNQEALDQISGLKEKAEELVSKEQELQDKETLLGAAKKDLETKENELSDIQHENEDLKTKVAESDAKDQELIELRKKLADLTPKSIDDMTIPELQDYITEKGYLIPTAQKRDDLIAAIKAQETNA